MLVYFMTFLISVFLIFSEAIRGIKGQAADQLSPAMAGRWPNAHQFCTTGTFVWNTRELLGRGATGAVFVGYNKVSLNLAFRSMESFHY